LSACEINRFPRRCRKSDGFRKRSTHPTLAVKALEMAQRIVARCNRLDHRPHGGYKGRKPGTFEIVIKPFIIVFEIAVTEVTILNIWHGRENREQV
jgi:plasmid stabilization system protein ParE